LGRQGGMDEVRSGCWPYFDHQATDRSAIAMTRLASVS
jgi:hypothetical protein